MLELGFFGIYYLIYDCNRFGFDEIELLVGIFFYFEIVVIVEFFYV